MDILSNNVSGSRIREHLKTEAPVEISGPLIWRLDDDGARVDEVDCRRQGSAGRTFDNPHAALASARP